MAQLTLRVNPESEVPLYVQVKNQIRLAVERLPVADPAAAVVELAAYSKAAGAKLG